MPKALFFNVPAHGHVNPSLPLVAELVRRGHEITYYISDDYRARVEAVGAVFQPYTAVHNDYFDARGLDGSAPQKAACALLTTAGEILPELLEIARAAQPDYILFDGMCPWGWLVARILSLPAVTSLSLLPFGSLRSMINRQTYRLFLPLIFRELGKALEANRLSRALGAQYGIPPLGAMSIMSATGDITLSYTSSYFHPSADTVPDTVRFVGRILGDTPSAEAFSFERVQGRRLIYVSLGTVINDNAAFFTACIDAFAGGDAFVIMSTGNRISPDSFGELPENTAVYPWVPLLLVPQQDEQTLTALRVVELGAGLMLKKAQVNAESIRAGATRLLSDGRFKVEAQRIGETFRAAGGVNRAADEVDTLLERFRVPKVH